MLTKKDFKAVAEIIANSHGAFEDIGSSFYEGGRFDGAEITAEHLADYFVTQNPRFGRERFMKACGLN